MASIYTYDQLADQLRDIAANLGDQQQYWIGLAGAPGSGKSTLCEALSKRLSGLLTVIPMDGYHCYRHELDSMDDPEHGYARRGAPFTFNAERLVAELTAAKKNRSGLFPGFDHQIGDPVENVTRLTDEKPQVVLVEGNYLLLDEAPWCNLRKLFDESWFLYLPITECNRRVYQRHLLTGLSETEALRRVAQNDSVNAELITKVSMDNADKIIRIH